MYLLGTYVCTFLHTVENLTALVYVNGRATGYGLKIWQNARVSGSVPLRCPFSVPPGTNVQRFCNSRQFITTSLNLKPKPYAKPKPKPKS